MDEQILRVYSRQLTAQLKEKEEALADLQKRFSKLQSRFDQLDYAFKENLQLHQRQMIAIDDLHMSQKELRKVERDRWGQFCKLEEQLIQMTKGKEATKNGLAYWKQAVIDQKIFYEGPFEYGLKITPERITPPFKVPGAALTVSQKRRLFQYLIEQPFEWTPEKTFLTIQARILIGFPAGLERQWINGVDTFEYWRKFEECLRECKLKMEADAIIHQKTLKETQCLAEKHIQELAHRLKLNTEEGDVIRKKAIMSQGDVDVLRHRAQELACLIDNFPGTDGTSQAISSRIVRVLRSFGAPTDGYDNRLEELHQELLKGIARPAVNAEENILDYEQLRSQNLVLREVVKKLKKELTKTETSESIRPKPFVDEDPEKYNLEGKLVQLNAENKKLCDLLAEKDADLVKLKIATEKNIERLEMSSELSKSTENVERTNFSKVNIDLHDPNGTSKTAETDKKLINNSESQEDREFNDNKSQAAYRGLREGRVKKFKRHEMRNMMRSLELNLEPLNSRQRSRKNYVTLEDKQEVENNTGSGGKNTDENFSQGQLEPTKSHLNSVQYEEYTIPLWANHHLRIQHPMIQGSNGKIFRLRSVHSEREYQSIPIDETVLCFACEDGESVFLNSKMANCAVQTILIPTANVSTQTTKVKNTFDSQTSTGVRILNSERRAIERSLQDLEKTVSEAGEEALELARSMIVNTSKFPPSEEFFDCVKYLSQCGAP